MDSLSTLKIWVVTFLMIPSDLEHSVSMGSGISHIVYFNLCRDVQVGAIPTVIFLNHATQTHYILALPGGIEYFPNSRNS